MLSRIFSQGREILGKAAGVVVFGRLVLRLLPVLWLVGCAGRTGYGAYPGPPPRTGHVDVICLQGCSEDRGVPDTLFGCLLNARENNLGTVDLPEGVYLGHVSEFIVRTLRFYDIEDHFEHFYGYRIVLRIREVRPGEREDGKKRGYLAMAAGKVGDVAVSTMGGPMVSVTPVLFFFELGMTEHELLKLKQKARREDLPEPGRTSMDVVIDKYRRRYADLWNDARQAFGGEDHQDPVMKAYVVEECYIEKPDAAEVYDLVKRQDALDK